MTRSVKECRVCGKKYDACQSNRRGTDVFRWQEVACSPACGAIYLQQINESRNPFVSSISEDEVGYEDVALDTDYDEEDEENSAEDDEEIEAEGDY